MASSVVFPSSFNSKNITITAPKTLTSGAKQAYLNYGGERLVMQTAVAMSVPFGVGTFQNQSGQNEYSVELSFRGHEQRPEVKEFMDVMTQMDELLLQEGVKNSKTWFKADLGRDVVKAFYTPCVKYSKDKEGNVLSYPPNLKLKLRKNNGEFETKFYDISGNPYKGIPVEDLLAKGVQVTAIIECGGVWFAGSKFGLTWRAKQIAIHKLAEKMGDFAFKGLGSAPPPPAVDDDDDADNVSSSNQMEDDAAFRPSAKSSILNAVLPSTTPARPAAGAGASASAVSEAASIDDEDGDDVEPVPVPKKTIVKKKIITKAK